LSWWQFHLACLHKLVNLTNKTLHKTLIHATITKGPQANPNAVDIENIGHAALRKAFISVSKTAWG